MKVYALAIIDTIVLLLFMVGISLIMYYAWCSCKRTVNKLNNKNNINLDNLGQF